MIVYNQDKQGEMIVYNQDKQGEMEGEMEGKMIGDKTRPVSRYPTDFPFSMGWENIKDR